MTDSTLLTVGRPIAAERAVPAVTEIFRAFFLIGLCGFGGVLPWARYRLVEKKEWLTPTEFSELLGVAQIFPGPNVANLGTILGRRYRGRAGAFAAVGGLYLAPSAVILAIGYSYRYWEGSPILANILNGLVPAVVGLVVATSVKLIQTVKISLHGIVLMLVPALAVGVARLPLVWIMLVGGPVAVLWMRRSLSSENK